MSQNVLDAVLERLPNIAVTPGLGDDFSRCVNVFVGADPVKTANQLIDAWGKKGPAPAYVSHVSHEDFAVVRLWR